MSRRTSAPALRAPVPGEVRLSPDEVLYGLATGIIGPGPGIHHLDDVRQRCVVDEISGCWVWTGATSDGVPRMWSTSLATGRRCTMPGRAVTWQLSTGKPIPGKWRVFATCDEKLCVSPEHGQAMRVSEWGRQLAAAGTLKGRIKRVLANRRMGQRRSRLTPDAVQQLRNAPRGQVLPTARSLGIGRTAAYRVRTGPSCYDSVGGMFSQLLMAGGA